MNARIAAIAAYEQERISAAQEAARRKETHIAGMKASIHALYPRIEELIEVGEYARAHGIPLTGRSSVGCREGYDTHQFITNSWSHLTAFVLGDFEDIVGVGKMGGGACHYDLRVTLFADDAELVIDVNGDVEYVLASFLREFDEFESEFYAYIDRVTGREDNE